MKQLTILLSEKRRNTGNNVHRLCVNLLGERNIYYRKSLLIYIRILSFNYTALFDILEVESPCLYNNVHGKLCLNKYAENCASAISYLV